MFLSKSKVIHHGGFIRNYTDLKVNDDKRRQVMGKSKKQKDIPLKTKLFNERIAYAKSCKRLLCNK